MTAKPQSEDVLPGKKSTKKVHGKKAWKKLASANAEVLRVMNWALNRTKVSRSFTIEAGGAKEIIQQAFLEILQTGPRKLPCSWATAATNKVQWVRYKLIGLERRRKAVQWESLQGVATNEGFRNLEIAELREAFLEALELIKDDRLRTVLKLHCSGHSLSDIGKALGVSRERSRQLCDKAISKLANRSHLVAVEKLASWLPEGDGKPAKPVARCQTLAERVALRESQKPPLKSFAKCVIVDENLLGYYYPERPTAIHVITMTFDYRQRNPDIGEYIERPAHASRTRPANYSDLPKFHLTVADITLS